MKRYYKVIVLIVLFLVLVGLNVYNVYKYISFLESQNKLLWIHMRHSIHRIEAKIRSVGTQDIIEKMCFQIYVLKKENTELKDQIAVLSKGLFKQAKPSKNIKGNLGFLKKDGKSIYPAQVQE